MILSSVLDLAVIPVLHVVIEKARERRGMPGTLGQQEHADDHGTRQP